MWFFTFKMFGSAAVTPVAPAYVVDQWLVKLRRNEPIVRLTDEPSIPYFHVIPR